MLNQKFAFGRQFPPADKARPRPHVMAAYQASHEKFGSLYKRLAE
jgi:hypothetical protein